MGLGTVEDGGYGLAIELHISLPGLDRAEAEGLVTEAHRICPYSRAVRGNVDVQLILDEPTS